MDINIFLGKLIKLMEQIEEIVTKIENSTSNGMKAMSDLIKEVQELLPDWFFFIEQTGIGDKEEIIGVLTDVTYGIEAEDSIFLTDALLYGLGELIAAYRNVIEEALNEE